MALKGKKRPLNNSDKPAASETTNVQQHASSKNMKAGKKQQPEQSPLKKNKAEKLESNQVQPTKRKVDANLLGQSPPKKPKVQKTQPESPPKAETKLSGKKPSLEALAKRKEKKKELRKQKRQAEGQYKPENVHSSEEELVSKIAQLESLPTKSKTARRKLAVLKKKLKIKQGVYEPPAPMATKQPKKEQKVANNSENASIPSNNTKQNSKIEKKSKLDKSASLAVTKGLNLEKNNAGKNKKMEKAKPAKKVVEKEAEVSDDDEDDEEADESMDVSNVSVELDESKIEEDETDDDNDNEEEEEDDEEEDDDEDEENDDEKQNATEKDEEDDEEQEKQDDDDDDDQNEDDVPPAKNKKLPGKTSKPADQSSKSDDSQKKKRFVLFVGNLAYSATVDDIKKHFLTRVSNVTSVRIPINPKTRSSRGIAFVEFTNSVDYEKAFSLHNSTINGRMISVQYSSGGSKKINNKPEIVAKNKKLHALRKQGKLAGSVKDSQKRNVRRNKFKPQE